MEIFRHVYQIGSSIADRNLFRGEGHVQWKIAN